MATISENFLNTIYDSDEEDYFPLSAVDVEGQERRFEIAARLRFSLQDTFGFGVSTSFPQRTNEDRNIRPVEDLWEVAVSDGEEEPDVPRNNVNSGVDQIQESLGLLAFLSPGSMAESDSVDQLFQDVAEDFGVTNATSSQSADRPRISPASSTLVHGETPVDLTGSLEPAQPHNVTRPRRRDLFRSHGNSASSEDGVPRVRKRDLFRAKLRRIAFSEPVDEDAATIYLRQRHRVFTKSTDSKSQRQAVMLSSAKENRAALRKRLESLKTITHIAEGSKELSCAICWDTLRDTVMVPCGHVTSCYGCSMGCKKCPVCRNPVEDRVKAPCPSTRSSKNDLGCGTCGSLRDGLFYRCGHICMCFGCSKGIEQCPLCQKKVKRSVRIFWS